MENIEARMIDSAPLRTYFAAVNSGRGFVSFYHQIFGDCSIRKRYIIKGGPGTGKSSFMRRVADTARAYGKRIEYFRCSSDPDSLDGVIIDGNTVLIDGTAPHVYEPELAGAVDEIINLGEFWDSDELYKSYNDIAALSALKSEAYVKAYRFLSGALNVKEINDSLAENALLYDKMLGAAERLMRGIPDGEGYELKYGFVNAIGMSGCSHICSYERTAKKLYTIFDSYGMGSRFLMALVELAKKKGLCVKVSYKPIDPTEPDAVYLPESGVAVVLYCGGEYEGSSKINMKRFIDAEKIDVVKSEYRLNDRLYEALLSSAVDALGDAGKYHFKLEQIYISCMDFEAENRFADVFCKKLFEK